MADNKYTVQQLPVQSFLEDVKNERIAIPEIQRPFVWKRTQVRDFIDSLYNGYPTGYLITWMNPSVTLKDGTSSGSKKILIDGQQRVTALMAALLGRKVLNDEYESKRITIAFDPFPEPGANHFEVQDQSHLKSKKWIPDISVLFQPGFDSFTFVEEYRKSNPDVNPSDFNKEINKLKQIEQLQLGVIELASNLDIETVTEIFVRINSQGTVLNQSDFVMSRIAADTDNGGSQLRKTIDYFCHVVKRNGFIDTMEKNDPEFYEAKGNKMVWASKHKMLFEPTYGDVLRTSFMYAFGKSKMTDLASLLSGRNFETKTYEEEIVRSTFLSMTNAVEDYINPFNYRDFMSCLESVGFESPVQISSGITVDFAYALYLMLSHDPNIPKTKVKPLVGRWFIMSMLTNRYIYSPESSMGRDLRMICEKGCQSYLEEIEKSDMSEAFWDYKLVQSLETPRYSSPAFLIYVAAQVYVNDSSLLTASTKVSTLIKMSIGDVHHIFPKAYLKSNGFSQTQYNQVANFAYLDKGINISISDTAPCDYFSRIRDQCASGTTDKSNIPDIPSLMVNLKNNCIPEEIFDMDYTRYGEFLQKRRVMMAGKIREYYSRIKACCGSIGQNNDESMTEIQKT